MRARLPAHYHASLESRSVLKGGDLQKAVLDLVKSFTEGPAKLVFYPPNAPLIMYKYVEELCLPCKCLVLLLVQPLTEVSGHLRCSTAAS
jgi:hypothetical protein